MASLPEIVAKAAEKKESVERKSALEFQMTIPPLNSETLSVGITSLWGLSPRPLKFNRNSIWRNPEAFSSQEINKIVQELINKAQAKFTLPQPVLFEIMRVVMFSDEVTSDGYGPSSPDIHGLRSVYVWYQEKSYYFHKDESYHAFDFFQNEIWALESRKENEMRHNKYERDRKKFEEETFQGVKDDLHFQTAYQLHKTGSVKPLSQKSYWRQECSFILGNDVKAVVNEVREGHHRFF